MTSLFVELGTVLIVASLLALLFRRIKQPLILAYLIAGVIFVQFYTGNLSTDIFYSLAQIGIAFLLFLVGLNMNLRVLREVGRTSLFTGLGQVLFTALIGYFLVLLQQVCHRSGFRILCGLFLRWSRSRRVLLRHLHVICLCFCLQWR